MGSPRRGAPATARRGDLRRGRCGHRHGHRACAGLGSDVRRLPAWPGPGRPAEPFRRLHRRRLPALRRRRAPLRRRRPLPAFARHRPRPRRSPDDPPDRRDRPRPRQPQERGASWQEVAARGVEAFPSTVRAARSASAERGIRAPAVSASENCARSCSTRPGSPALRRPGRRRRRRRARAGRQARSRRSSSRRPAVSASRPAAPPWSRTRSAGVEAGRAGGFGVVVGVDRTGHPVRPGGRGGRRGGGRPGFGSIDRLGRLVDRRGLDAGPGGWPSPRRGPRCGDRLVAVNDWRLVYDGFDPEHEGLREALCTLGNGYLATRARSRVRRPTTCTTRAPTSPASSTGSPREVDGRAVENESLVNAPNWLPLTVPGDGGEWFDDGDQRRARAPPRARPAPGVLDPAQPTARSRGPDRCGHPAAVRQPARPAPGRARDDDRGRELVRPARRPERDRRHGAQHGCRPLRGPRRRPPRRRSAVDPHERRGRAPRGRDEPVAHPDRRGRPHPAVPSAASGSTSSPTVDRGAGLRRPRSSRVDVAEAARRSSSRRSSPCSPRATPASASLGRRPATGPTNVAGSFDELLERHVVSWAHVWGRARIELGADGDVGSRVLHLHLFHLLQTVSNNSVELDVGVPARGLHGEAYRGHIFWDELFVFPFLSLRLPAAEPRALLLYRYRRLDQARRAADRRRPAGRDVPVAEREQRPRGDPDAAPEPGVGAVAARRLAPAAPRQRGDRRTTSGSTIQATDDLEFLRFYGAEMLLEIARFWASVADLQPLARPLRDHGRDGARRVPRAATRTATSPGSTTTPTRT